MIVDDDAFNTSRSHGIAATATKSSAVRHRRKRTVGRASLHDRSSDSARDTHRIGQEKSENTIEQRDSCAKKRLVSSSYSTQALLVFFCYSPIFSSSSSSALASLSLSPFFVSVSGNLRVFSAQQAPALKAHRHPRTAREVFSTQETSRERRRREKKRTSMCHWHLALQTERRKQPERVTGRRKI